MKTGVLGGNGWVGKRLCDSLGWKPIAAKVFSEKQALEVLEREDIEALVNCAGKTGRPNVDWCELHKRETLEANSLLPLNLALACEKLNVRLVQVGSGCIFQGDNSGKGFGEEDAPNFYGSFYSRSKILAEELLADFKNVLHLRIRMPVDSRPGQRNLITKLSGYSRIINERNSITVLDDFVKAADALVKCKAEGIFNIVNQPATSHEEIIDLYRQIVDPKFSCTFISTEELEKMTAARRSNCVLSSRKLEEKGVRLAETRQAIAQCLEEYRKCLGPRPAGNGFKQ